MSERTDPSGASGVFEVPPSECELVCQDSMRHVIGCPVISTSDWLPSDHQRDRNDICRVCVYPGSEHTIGGPAPMGWGHCPHNPRRIAVVGDRTEPVERPRR